MSMLPPPTPMLPRLKGYAPEESLLLATAPAFDVDLTLDDADFLVPSGAPTSSTQNPPTHPWDSPEVGRGRATNDLTLDLDAYLPNAGDATFLRDTSMGSITSLPPPISPMGEGSPYARPSSALSWRSTSTAGPSTTRMHSLKRTPLASPEIVIKRPRTPVEPTPHKDDFYSRRMSDASRRASVGTPSFKAAERESEDLRRKVSRESFRRAGSTASLRSMLDDVECGRARDRSYNENTPLSTPEISTGSLSSHTPMALSSSTRTNQAVPFSPELIEASTSQRTFPARLSTPAKVIGFFAGLLGRSSSSSSLRAEVEQAEVEQEQEQDHENEHELELEHEAVAEEVEPPVDEWHEQAHIQIQYSLPALSRVPIQTTIHAPPLRQAPAAPKPAYPFVPPLTRPQGPKFATDKRATRPIQKDAAPRPLAVKEQNKVIGTSSFAKAALAKLPPPGKGSTAAGEKVHVKSTEHPKDFGGVRNVWERLAKENNNSAPRPEEKKVLKRTVPVQGHTPGKASLARAREREAREAIRRERRAELEGQKRR